MVIRINLTAGPDHLAFLAFECMMSLSCQCLVLLACVFSLEQHGRRLAVMTRFPTVIGDEICKTLDVYL